MMYVFWYILMIFDVFCIYFSNVSGISLCIWRFLQVPATDLPEPELPHAVRAAEARVLERVVFANQSTERWPYEHLWTSMNLMKSCKLHELAQNSKWREVEQPQIIMWESEKEPALAQALVFHVGSTLVDGTT